MFMVPWVVYMYLSLENIEIFWHTMQVEMLKESVRRISSLSSLFTETKMK